VTRDQPTLWIIAGPNGAGKTTYAFRHIRAVSGTARFVNLDEIARGLSPLDPEAEQRRAARVALDMMRELIAERRSFSIETTLAGRTHLQTVAQARASGFRCVLLFFAVRSVDISLARIARRVSEGGHDVPETDVRRRFERAMANLPAYIGLVDLWRVLDNNGGRPEAVAEGRRGCVALRRESDGLPDRLIAALAGLPACAEGSG
jgi:predicted ABC-type ATPase